jgi:tetratricopeptide (TPR) repeat protein
MMRRFVASLVAIGALVALPAAGSVTEEWFEVQEVLSAPEGRSIEDPVDELVRAAEEIDVRRLTPQASALVLWSQSAATEGEIALRSAIRLDPELPASYFLLSRLEWQRGEFSKSVIEYLKGWRALLEFEVTRRNFLSSIGIWVIAGCAGFAVMTIFAVALRTFRRLAHDAVQIGQLVFERSNAFVFGLVILFLPLFAGLGPAWLVVFLFVSGWIYLDRMQRVVALGCCLVLSLVPVLLDGWQASLLRVPSVMTRVSHMLDERQLDPSSLREFINLRNELEGKQLYHLLLGELLRMHSEIEAAKVEFHAASLDAGRDSRSFVILGNMALEDGNVGLAIQHFDEAIEADPNTALAYHNLSSAYDLNRRFQQGDAARTKARELAGGSSTSIGIRGRDPRIRYPLMTSSDVTDLVSGLDHEQLLRVGAQGRAGRSLMQFLSPHSMVFWIGAGIGAIVLAIRLKWFPACRECTKCGKVYRIADEPGQSAVYCRQCVSVFLQRDMVPIDQQTAKLGQVRRWESLSTFGRRLMSVIAPRRQQVLSGEVVSGVVTGLFLWVLLAGILVWVPRFLAVIEPTMEVLPVSSFLVLCLVVIWIRSIQVSWPRR